MPWDQLLASITGGCLVAAAVAARRAVRRRAVPRALSRWVPRRSYLDTVLRLSRSEDVERLDAFVPNLRPAGHDEALRDLQVEWQRINGERGVRLVTGQHHACLKAGAELLGRGVEVRVAPGLGGDDLSYHVFTGKGHCTVLNHRDGDRDRPNRLDGTPTARVFQAHFEDLWTRASPLEAVLADHLRRSLRREHDLAEAAVRLRELRAKYGLNPVVAKVVARHFAARRSAAATTTTTATTTAAVAEPPGAGALLRHLVSKLFPPPPGAPDRPPTTR